jgi:hypothetical protein
MLNDIESRCIASHNAIKMGYNITAGGSWSTNASRMQASVSATGRVSARKGVKLPPEQVEAHRQMMLGRRASPETRAKMSATHRARYEAHPEKFVKSDEEKERARITQTGKKCSSETLLKMSLAKLGKKKSEETKQRMKDSWKLRAPFLPKTPEQQARVTAGIQASWDRRRGVQKEGVSFQFA